MDPIITSKLGAAKLIAENLILIAETGDWESFEASAEDLTDLAKIESDKVIIEECPMAASGTLISPYPKQQ